MGEHQLIADSCCELTPELIEALDAKSVPLSMLTGSHVFVDDENLDVEYFLETMLASSELTKSACPSPSQYCDAFLSGSANSVFGVTLSSRLSGSYNSAIQGKMLAEEENPEKQIHVFDSKSASAGEVLVSLKIKELAEQGLPRKSIISSVEKFIKEIHTYFILENTDTLVKNGRIPSFLGKAVSLLNLKFILGSDGDGNVKLFSKARGFGNGIKKMADLVAEQIEETKDKTLVITHCFNEEYANILKNFVEATCQFKQILIYKTRGLSSMYAGRGGVIMAY